jgi:hypothetical protein
MAASTKAIARIGHVRKMKKMICKVASPPARKRYEKAL